MNSTPHSIDLTLALVGKRRIDPDHIVGMKRDLTLAFDALAGGLREVAGAGDASLTLVTGLADGADQIASALFLAGASGSMPRILGAILPCAGDEFARNGPIENRAAFERAARSCAFVTVLPGRLRPPPPDGLDTEIARLARRARGDAFAAQADALLEDADVLVAIDDPDDDGDIGGTRHTLHRALSRGLPVILVCLGHPGLSLPKLGSPIGDDETLQSAIAASAVAALAAMILESSRSRRPRFGQRTSRPPL
jgi:hypothetical protein